MKLNSINSAQAFCGNKEQGSQKSFMGRVSDVIDNTTKALNDTVKATDDLTDFVISTKNAINSPEEVTIRVLNNQLEKNIVNNEKSPSWVKKPATYLSGIFIGALSFFATKKVVNAPGAVTKWTKGMIAKTDIGNSALKLASNAKEAFVGLGDKITSKIDLSTLTSLKNKAAAGLANVKHYLAQKMPNVAHFVKGSADAIQLDKWTKSDYVKNAISVIVGTTSGKEFIDRHYPSKDTASEVVKDVDDDDEIRDAA